MNAASEPSISARETPFPSDASPICLSRRMFLRVTIGKAKGDRNARTHDE